MNPTNDMLQVLTEIRDLQKDHLEEFRKLSARSIESQEENKQRVLVIFRLYKRALVVGGIVFIGLIALLVWLMAKLQSLPLPDSL